MEDYNFRFKVKEMLVIPSSGGVFEVYLNEELVFSKKELDRFPNTGEIPETIRQKS